MRRPKRYSIRSLFLICFIATAAPKMEAKTYQIGLIMAKADRSKIAQEVLNATTSAFIDSKRFKLIERARLDAVFTERDLQDFIQGTPGDLSDLEGVDMLGLLSYSEGPGPTGGRNYYIDVRLTEVRTGRVWGTLTSRRETFEAPDTPYQAGRYLLQNIREKFPPEGYVIRITGENYTIDLGTAAGIVKGDELEVIREGEAFFHPVTNVPMPAIEEVVGVLRVRKTFDQMATCRQKNRKDAGQIQVEDRVRLKPKNELLRKIVNKIPFIRKKLKEAS